MRTDPLSPSADPQSAASTGDACLVAICGPELGRRWPLELDETIVGRDDDCGVAVPIDTVSRRHCRIRREGAAFLVADLGSTNGTAVDDEPLAAEEERPLRSGDRIRVGAAIFRFLRGPDLESLYREEIYRTVISDGLTGACSLRFLTEFLERELSRCRRHGRPLSLVLFDLDEFKRVNDGFGHLNGDRVLREVAELVREQVRREDCFGRFDGDAFAVVLTESDAAHARAFAERLRERVANHEFHLGAETVPVAISIGVATREGGEGDAAALLAAASARLGEARAAGRGRIAG